jgi:predicted phage tail protein
MSIAEMLALVARTGRASPTWAKGILGVVFDKENLPITQVFGMSNIVANSFNVTYITANLADEFVVKFTNRDNDYKLDEVRQKTPGTVSPVNSVEVTIPGVTSAAQAGKEANLLAARQYYGRRRVSFETDVEGLVCSRGDVISVSHDLTNWAVSGRLVSGTTTALTLDRAVTFESAAAHYIGVRYPDGTYVIRQVVNPYAGSPVTTASITLSSALPSAPNSDVTNAVHDYIYSFDPTNSRRTHPHFCD